jgi:hypothetical protein
VKINKYNKAVSTSSSIIMQATSEKPYKKSGLISGLKNSSVFSAVMQGKISELEVALLADKKANDSLEKYITVDKEGLIFSN